MKSIDKNLEKLIKNNDIFKYKFLYFIYLNISNLFNNYFF